MDILFLKLIIHLVMFFVMFLAIELIMNKQVRNVSLYLFEFGQWETDVSHVNP